MGTDKIFSKGGGSHGKCPVRAHGTHTLTHIHIHDPVKPHSRVVINPIRSRAIPYSVLNPETVCRDFLVSPVKYWDSTLK
jgi:hypothetical protein